MYLVGILCRLTTVKLIIWTNVNLFSSNLIHTSVQKVSPHYILMFARYVLLRTVTYEIFSICQWKIFNFLPLGTFKVQQHHWWFLYLEISTFMFLMVISKYVWCSLSLSRRISEINLIWRQKVLDSYTHDTFELCILCQKGKQYTHACYEKNSLQVNL